MELETIEKLELKPKAKVGRPQTVYCVLNYGDCNCEKPVIDEKIFSSDVCLICGKPLKP